MLTLGFIVAIALMGAAGSGFIGVHLARQRRAGGSGGNPGRGDWRRFRHPHLAARQSPKDRAIVVQEAKRLFWSFALMFAGLALLAMLLAAMRG